MPSTLHVPPHPFFYCLDIFLAVRELVSDIRLVAVQNVGFRPLGRRRVEDTPATMLQTSAQIAREGITLRRLEIHVVGTGRRVVVEERVHGLNLTGVGVHTACRLSRLDVTPDHRCHVTFIVHEARVEIRGRIGVSRFNVRESSRERVLQEVEHSKEVSRRPIRLASVTGSIVFSGWCLHEHVVAKPTSDNGVMHHRLVRLVLEVCLPAVGELGCGPGLKLFKFLLIRADFYTSLDTISGKGSGSLQRPFVVDL